MGPVKISSWSCKLARIHNTKQIANRHCRDLSIFRILRSQTPLPGYLEVLGRKPLGSPGEAVDTIALSGSSQRPHPSLRQQIYQSRLRHFRSSPDQPSKVPRNFSTYTPTNSTAKTPSKLSSSDAAMSEDLRHLSMGKSTKEWLVHVPDRPDMLSTRLAARPTHLEKMKPSLDAGLLVFGGATLAQHPAEGETPDMTGSVLLLKADTKEQVLEWLRKDPYTQGGAWDVDRATIWPFKSALRVAL